jgi:hypothetical protein
MVLQGEAVVSIMAGMIDDGGHASAFPAGWCCLRCGATLQPGSRFCHMCGEKLTGVLRPRLFTALRVLLALGWVACLIGWLLIFLDTETVVGSGPVILLVGLVLMIVGAVQRRLLSALIGAGHCGVCLLFFTLVAVFDWSPSGAHVPFLIMGILYVVAITPLTVLAWRKPPHARPPWECQVCGYLLYGLSEPRCPECGTEFDPSRLAGLTPPALAARGAG